jgi:hypothetical protein
MPPGRSPGPPGSGGTNPARRRRAADTRYRGVGLDGSLCLISGTFPFP